MKRFVTREIPDIRFLSAKDLTSRDKMILIYSYHHDINEPFTIGIRGKETILLNEELKDAEETVRLINEIMATKYLDKAEHLFDEFKRLNGDNAATILLYIWNDWRKEKRAAELNQRAQDILDEIKSRRLRQKIRKEKAIIDELFSIGFGTYDDKAECDWDKGKENTFLYGYLLGIKASEAQKERVAV